MATFSERLKELRKNKGLTLDELAEKLDTTKSTLSRYENDWRDPKSDFVKKAASFFDVSLDYLLGRPDTKKIITKNFVKENIDLIRGSMTYEEMSKNISERLNSPRLLNLITSRFLENIAKGKETNITPQIISLLSIYAQVKDDFFYRHNANEDLFLAQEDYKKQKDLKSKDLNTGIKATHLDNEMIEFILDPRNLKYLQFARKVKQKGYEPDDIIGLHSKFD